MRAPAPGAQRVPSCPPLTASGVPAGADPVPGWKQGVPDHLRAGRGATEAARRAVSELADDVGGAGGIICCDRQGRLGAAHNAAYMAFGAGIQRAGGPALTAGVEIPPGTDLMARL